jgi:hypothetical protein
MLERFIENTYLVPRFHPWHVLHHYVALPGLVHDHPFIATLQLTVSCCQDAECAWLYSALGEKRSTVV